MLWDLKLYRAMEYGHVGIEGSEITSWREPVGSELHVHILGFRPTSSPRITTLE